MLTVADYLAVALYVAVIIAIAVWAARRTATGDDLFLAGRTLTWGVIGLSLFATNVSSTTLVGLMGQAYSTGIVVANYEWMATVVLIFMALFFIPYYIRSRISTLPEFLERRFDHRSRRYFSGFTVVVMIGVDTAGSLYAGALVMHLLLPEIPLWQGALALALFAGFYTAAGGLRAVVYSDVLQAVILIIGAAVTAWMVFAQFGFSWRAATAALPEGHLSMIRPLDDPTLPWLGTLVGVPVLGFYFWCTNQFMVQRILAARDVDHARWGAMLAGLLKLLPVFLLVIPGMLAAQLLPELDRPDAVFPALVLEVLPAGLTGLVLVALVVAIMSSVDSTLNSAATLVVKDFIEVRRHGLTPRRLRRIGRITTLVFMVVAAAWVPVVEGFPGLFIYLQQALSYLVPPVAVVFVMGMFTRSGNGAAALVTLVGGHALSLALFGLHQLEVLTLHFTVVAGVLAGAGVLLYTITAGFTSAPASSRLAGTIAVDGAGLDEPVRCPWYTDVRVQSAALLTAVAILLIVFW